MSYACTTNITMTNTITEKVAVMTNTTVLASVAADDAAVKEFTIAASTTITVNVVRTDTAMANVFTNNAAVVASNFVMVNVFTTNTVTTIVTSKVVVLDTVRMQQHTVTIVTYVQLNGKYRIEDGAASITQLNTSVTFLGCGQPWREENLDLADY